MSGNQASFSSDLMLTLIWTCQSCGWRMLVNAPGFAGDGKQHYVNGVSPCGPITAQRATQSDVMDEYDRLHAYVSENCAGWKGV